MAHRQRRPMSATNAINERGNQHHMQIAPHLYTFEQSLRKSNQEISTQHRPAWHAGHPLSNLIPRRTLEDHHFRLDQHHLSWEKYMEFDLPPTHQGIAHHPTVIEANQHLQTQELQPQWTRITTTPFTRKAQLCGGMGRKITNSTISAEFPLAFQNPERMNLPESLLCQRDAMLIGNRVPKKQEKDDALFLLPSGDGILRGRMTKKSFDSYRTLQHGKQSYFENIITPRGGKNEYSDDFTPRTGMMIINGTKTAWPGAGH